MDQGDPRKSARLPSSGQLKGLVTVGRQWPCRHAAGLHIHAGRRCQEILVDFVHLPLEHPDVLGGGGTQDTDFNKGFTKGFVHICLGNAFPKQKHVLDSKITSWDLTHRIPSQKLPI